MKEHRVFNIFNISIIKATVGLLVLFNVILFMSCSTINKTKADNYIINGQYDKAIDYYNNVVENLGNTPNDRVEAAVNQSALQILKKDELVALIKLEKFENQPNVTGTAYKEMIDFLKVLCYFKMAKRDYSVIKNLKFFEEEHKDSKFLGLTYYMMAKLNFENNELAKGIKYANKSLKLSEDTFYTSDLLKNLAYFYSNRGNYYLAQNYYNRILKLKQAVPADKAASVYWLAQYFDSQNKTKKAREYHLMLIDKYPDMSSFPESLYWLAKSYEKDNEISKAVFYYKRLVNEVIDSDLKSVAEKRLAVIQPSSN